MDRRGVLGSVAVLLVVAASLGALAAASDSDGRRPVGAPADSKKAPPLALGARQHPRDPLVRRWVRLGRSVEGRAIAGIALGDPDATRKLLVVGIIHGNETAGGAIAGKLASGPPPRRSLLWIVPDLNPDGVAAGTRQNARGVDLNRNFPWHRRLLGGRTGLEFPVGVDISTGPTIDA